MRVIRWVTETELFGAFGYARGIGAIDQTLSRGFDPAQDNKRIILDFSHGHGLVMPSEEGKFAGLKFVTVAPGNRDQNLPRIQGVYTLLDSATLSPLAQCDGAALTLLRTSCVTTATLSKIGTKSSPRVFVFGSGPQALAHILALSEISTPREVYVRARNVERVGLFLEELTSRGFTARVGSDKDLAISDVVILATTARQPLLSPSQLKKDAVVAAVGSHESDARELPGELFADSQVFVEDIDVALREAGDVIMAIDEGYITREGLVEMRALFSGGAHPTLHSRRVYKSVGMPWQDLSVFGAAYEFLS